ncbi:transcription factor MAMYB [Solanum pennellii]|uniref:Transcription factor MAMYB n=1 Tax=Solanum pennellii TaxID=28526 RepID=A0ABM1VFR8_SOLPN|nr:transcription factor MAMYB [Solanum pennellii]XP_027774587.1 transcription factor MAMYB [Solanum pennellii]
MEFLDEDAKPRFLFQSKPLQQSNSDPETQTRSLYRPGIIISISLAVLFFALSILYFSFEPFGSIFLWISLSLLVGPFAPSSVTGGDIRVGLGEPIQDPPKDDLSDTEPDTKKSNRRSNRPTKKNVDFEPVLATNYDLKPEKTNGSVANSKNSNGSVANLEKKVGDGVWNEGDEELLRKMMGKHPVGKPGRWEAIADGFNGRYKVESVIKKSKELGEKKMSDGDSYQRFLKDRKTVDKRAEGGNEADFENVEAKKAVESGWSSGEDLALLNALKTFPKEVAMRWEKIAAAVPGKNKAACMKRMAELKKDFRSSKSANAEA